MKKLKKSFAYLLLLFPIVFFSCSNVENKFKNWIPSDNNPSAPKVIHALPSANQTGVAKDSPVTFTFNKEVDQKTCTTAFSIQPPMTGLYEFNGFVMKFKPSTKLRGGITYIANLSKQCEDKEGRDLEKPYSMSFTVSTDTTQPDLVSIQARKNSSGCNPNSPLVEIVNFPNSYYSTTDICKNTTLVLNFSKSMNRSSVEGNFVISPQVIGSYVWSNNNQTMQFNAKDIYQNGVTYVGSVGNQALDSSENRIDNTVTFSFTIGNESVRPVITMQDGYLKGGTTCNPGVLASSLYGLGLKNQTGLCSSIVTGYQNSPIFIHFSEDMDISTADSAFTISPSINGIKAWGLSSNSLCGSTGPCTGNNLLTFTPTTSWQNAVTYTVSLLGSASDVAGNALGDQYSFSFTVGSDFQIPQVIRPDGYLMPGCNPGPGTLASVLDPVFGLRDKTGFCSSIVPGSSNSPVIIDFTEDMDISSTESAFSISPSIIGVKSWLASPLPQCGTTGPCTGGTSQLTFTPSQPWSISTYSVNIGSSAKDLDGNSFGGYSFSFTVGTDFMPPEMDYTLGGPLFGDKATAPCTAAAITSINNLDIDICNTAAGSNFRIRFSEAMDQSQTMNAFSISPSVNGSFSWPFTNELLFTPSQNLELNKQYRITISASAKDLAGNGLVSDFTRYFTTGNGSGFVDNTPPSVVDLFSDLTGGAGGCDGGINDSLAASFLTNVCTDNAGTGQGANFQVQFSENMNQSVTAQTFSISPSVSGVLSWTAGNILVFSATQALDPNKQYTITIGQNAEDLAGNKLQAPYLIYFETSAVGGNPSVTTITVPAGTVTNCSGGLGVATDILSSTVNNACQGNPANSPIIFNFSEGMNQSRTQAAISLSPSVTGVYSWTSATQLQFTPDSALSYGQRYNISVSTAAEDLQGQRIGNQLTGSFVVGALDTTSPNLSCPGCGVNFEINGDGDSCGAVPNDVLNQQNGSSSTTNVCTGGDSIQITFSEAMNQLATSNAISFSPSVNVTYTWAGNIVTIRPLTALASNKAYTLSVSTSAKDLAGNSLPSSFSVGFTTENISPKVYAVGLGSQAACLNYTGVPSTGNVLGGNWLSANCLWDNTLSILPASSYKFLAGNQACINDAQTDNIRIIFDKPMDIVSAAAAVNLRRISPPVTSVTKASWIWSDSNHVLTMSFAESPLCMDLVRNAGDDPFANYPFYILEIDQTAKDANGNTLSSPFNFYMEGE